MSWPMKTIGDVCDVIPGFAFKSKDLGDVGIPVIKIGNITERHSVDIESAQCLPEDLIENRHKKYFLQNGDILIAMTGATAGKVGRIRCAEDQVLLLNQRVAKLHPISINPDFFWSAISTDRYRTLFYGLGGGAAQPNMSGSQIESIEIPCPPLEQQERIANILSAYDDLIENNRRRIQLLEQAARLLYKEWFVHLRFPGHEHVKVIDGVPEGWEQIAASDAFEVNPKVKRDDDGIIRHLPMSALSETSMVIDRGALEGREKSTSVRFQNGDTLFARITPCLENGKTGYVQFLAEDEVGCGSTEFIVLRGRHVSNYFVYLTARQQDFRENAIHSMIGSSGRQRVQPSCFDRYLVPIPSKGLAALFDDAVGEMFAQIANLDQQNQKLAQARDLLLPRLMNGELAV